MIRWHHLAVHASTAAILIGAVQLSGSASADDKVGAGIRGPAGATAGALADRKERTRPSLQYDLAGPNPASSLAELDNRIKLHPQAPQGYLHRGQAYLLDGDTDNALKDFNKALAIDPHFAPAFIGRARIYQEQQQYNRAFADLQQAAALGTEDVKLGALWEAAFLRREIKQLPAAVHQYDQLLNLMSKLKATKPRQALVTVQRGETYHRMGNLTAAVADCDAALILDPDLNQAHMTRARMYAALHNLPKALADYNIIIAQEKKEKPGDFFGGLSSTLPTLYKERSDIYRALGKPELAVKDLKAAQQYQAQTLQAVPFRSMP